MGMSVQERPDILSYEELHRYYLYKPTWETTTARAHRFGAIRDTIINTGLEVHSYPRETPRDATSIPGEKKERQGG